MKTPTCESITVVRRASNMPYRRSGKVQNKPLAFYDMGAANRCSAIIEFTGDAIITSTLNGIITSWNPAAEAIFGYEAAEIIGQAMVRLVPIERLEEEYLVQEHIIAGEKYDHFETVRIRKDGVPIDISVCISPLPDQDGHIIGTSMIARNITEKSHLQVAAEQFRALVDSSDDAIITKTLDGRISSWNLAAQKIFGYTASEALGQPMLRLFPEDRVDEENFILNKILSGEKVDHFETVRVHKNGTQVFVSVTISPILDRFGRIVGASKIARDITQLHQQEEQLKHIAHFDALTGLPNRLLMTDRLRQAMAHAKRNDQELAVLYLDLDGFKYINDKHGHNIGDALLIALSMRIGEQLHNNDTLARIGGDEFVVVLGEVRHDEQLHHVVMRILHACSEPVYIEGLRLDVSASIGVTTYPHDNVDEDLLLRHADLAMYEAKQSGKNRYARFDASREAEGKSRYLHVRRLSQALEQDELLLYYQPKVNMRTNEVIGVEALIRWQHPERGLLAPGQFLPMIEGHHLNEQIGLWVINHALTQMQIWKQEGIRMPVSVNLAPNQLQNPDFPTLLLSLLEQHSAIDPTDLELEILETTALHDFETVSSVIQSCRNFGVQFSIDDFGTGYSSLTYLKRLSATTLKIDQSFVRDMLVDQEDLAIVCGVIGLAQAFQRKVIAEGVETRAHGEKLLELGCELAQGYGISRPMDGQTLPSWLIKWRDQRHWSN